MASIAPPITPCAALLALVLVALPRTATPACAPVAPVACPNCFAVFVMPDTQSYVYSGHQPKGGAHLDLVTRYICDNRTAWTEPTTGKQMPILMTIHLGDIVERGDGGGPDNNDGEWLLADSAFDNLDSCSPTVPYLVTLGNHDIVSQNYQLASDQFETHFGTNRWTSQGYGCTATNDCNWNAGEWFIGGGDAIDANSRNNIGSGTPGPPTPQAGRHRAARIEAPNGQPFLFMGLELAFDFPPAPPGFGLVEGDDSTWPVQIMNLHHDTATIVFHHSMLWAFPSPDNRLRWGPETWLSDSITQPMGAPDDPNFGTTGGMEAVYQRLVEPFPQALFLFTGHVLRPRRLADYTIPRTGAPAVSAFMRNYQNLNLPADPSSPFYGAGWNVIAVFDPDAQEVRVRSYRIDDVDAYAMPPVDFDHTGAPAATECFDTDESGFGERIIPWDFQVSGNPAPSVSPAGLGALSALLLAGAFRVMARR